MDNESETQATKHARELVQGITEESKPDVARGSPESAAWFRAALLDIEQTQASMARLMKRKGDDRKLPTIERHMRRMANGEARVSGEMRVVLTMMRAGKRKSEKRIAEKALRGEEGQEQADAPA